MVEVVVGLGVTGIMLVSLFAGFSYCFAVTRLSRENLRATQILQDKMEVVRLLNWDQVTKFPGFVPETFSAPFYASDPANPSGGFSYTGTVLLTNAPVTESYGRDLRMIRVEVTWQSGNKSHRRQMTTFVTQYGLQKYIY